MAERWAVVCGKIRDEDAMLAKLETLRRWSEEGHLSGVVVSTWLGEIDHYPRTRHLIHAAGFYFIELQEPSLKGPGHFIHQAKAFQYALDLVPDEAMVLKLRPDLFQLSDTVLDAILTLRTRIPHGRRGAVLSGKVIVANCFLDSPFYIGDIIFYGAKRDVRKVMTSELDGEIRYSNLAPEQLFFCAPFISTPTMANGILSVYMPFAFGDQTRATERLDAMLRSPYYRAAFCQYMILLDANFVVGFDRAHSRQAARRYNQGVVMEDIFADTQRPFGIERHEGANANYFANSALARAIVERRIADSPLGRLFLEAMDVAEDPASWTYAACNALRPPVELLALRDALLGVAADMPYSIDCSPTEDERHIVIRGHPGRFALVVDTDEVRALNQEINYLRRAIDEMRASPAL